MPLLPAELIHNTPLLAALARLPYFADHDRASFELVLASKGKEIYLGDFNWGDTPKEYAVPAFGTTEPIKLAGRHSVVLKYDVKDSFAQLCQKLQSR